MPDHEIASIHCDFLQFMQSNTNYFGKIVEKTLVPHNYIKIFMFIPKNMVNLPFLTRI